MFGLFRSKEDVKKHNHLINLVALAKSDGRIDEKEIDLLQKIAKQNGISDKSFKAILETSDPLDIDISIAKEKRLGQLYDFIEMMLIDDVVSDSEYKFCIDVAEKLNFSSKNIPTLVNQMMERIKKGESKDDVCNAVEGLVEY